MRKMSNVLLVSALFVLLHAPVAVAGWKTCMGCHNGSMAPTAEAMKEKYPSAEAFVKAASGSASPLMKAVQQDEQALKDAARDIGLQ